MRDRFEGLEQRAARGDRRRFEAVLAKVPADEPRKDDRLDEEGPSEDGPDLGESEVKS